MRGGDNSYPGVQLVALKVADDRLRRRYFPANYLKFSQLLPTRWTNVILLS